MSNWNDDWTDEETGTVLIERDKTPPTSFGKLAKMLPGRTRNAVAGKVNRLGLCKAKTGAPAE